MLRVQQNAGRVAVRSSIKSRETSIMHGVSSVKYDGVSHLMSTPELYRLIAWAKAHKPQLHKEYVRADSAMWHAMESKDGRKTAVTAAADLRSAFEKIEAAFKAAMVN